MTPRSFAGFISTGSPSPCHLTHAPGFATATSCCGARLIPPQTITDGSGSPTVYGADAQLVRVGMFVDRQNLSDDE